MCLIVFFAITCDAQCNVSQHRIRLLREEYSLPNDSIRYALDYEAIYARDGRILRTIEPCENHEGEMDTFYRNYDLRRRLVSVNAHCSDSEIVLYRCKYIRDTCLRMYAGGDTVKDFCKFDKQGREVVRVTENATYKYSDFNEYDTHGRLIYSHRLQESKQYQTTSMDHERQIFYLHDSVLVVERSVGRSAIIFDSTYTCCGGTVIKHVQTLKFPNYIRRIVVDSMVFVLDSSGSKRYHYSDFQNSSADTTGEIVLSYVELFDKTDSIISRITFSAQNRILADGLEYFVNEPYETTVIKRDSLGRKRHIQIYRWNWDYVNYKDTMESEPVTEIWFDDDGRWIRRTGPNSEQQMVYDSLGHVIEDHNYRGGNYDWEHTYFQYDSEGNNISTFKRVGDNFEYWRAIIRYY